MAAQSAGASIGFDRKSSHAHSQAALAILTRRARRQGNDRQVPARRALVLANRKCNREAVHFRHVQVEQ